MSMIEILNELPKLKPDERNFLFLQLHDLDAQVVEESPAKMTVTGDAEITSGENDLSFEEIRDHLRKCMLSD